MSLLQRLIFASLWTLFFIGSASSQQVEYPPTITLPVTFYDFHADSSNPEFEVNPPPGKLQMGMVADTLDSERKPVVGRNPFFSNYVGKWFRPFAKGDFTRPVYDTRQNIATSGQLLSVSTVTFDTSFINVKIESSLAFRHVGNGVYEYDNQNFFLLDSLGFKIEPRRGYNGPYHNYGFTMELHSSFTYQPGQRFEFRGDDDVWAFVNGKLVMDLGGVHGSQTGSFNADNLGLTPGVKYSFDLFYAERHTTQSTIRIQTNIFTPPAEIRLYPKPDTPPGNGDNQEYASPLTVKAGVPLPVYPHVFDTTGKWRPEYDPYVTWVIQDASGEKPLVPQNGGITFTSTEAYQSVKLVATFTDPTTGKKTQTIALVTVQPGPEDHLVIEGSAPLPTSLDDNPIAQIMLTDQATTREVFAVVRDAYGNFIREATNANWQPQVPTVAAVEPQSGRRQRAVITALGDGVTTVTVNEGQGLKPGSTTVTVTNVTRRASTRLISAVSRDNNGDGYLDAIELTFDSLVTIGNSLPLGLISVTGPGGVKLPVGALSESPLIPRTTFTLQLTPSLSGAFQTGWAPLLTIPDIDGVASINGYQVADGAGPVIARARYFPLDSASVIGTLVVTFSEPVLWQNAEAAIPEQTFRYFREGSASPASDVFVNLSKDDLGTSDTGAVITFVHLIVPELKPGADRINILSGITDNSPAKNAPYSDNRHALVELGGDPRPKVQSGPNPFNPDLAPEFPPSIKALYQEAASSGIRQQVVTRGFITEVVLHTAVASGYYSIYDGLSNCLVKKRPMVKRANKGYCEWDGRTDGQRSVGAGTYLQIITVTDTDNVTSVSKVKIGVKKTK